MFYIYHIDALYNSEYTCIYLAIYTYMYVVLSIEREEKIDFLF